jgi:hypothetical protein
MSTEIVSWEDRAKREAKEVTENMRPDVGTLKFDKGYLSYEGVNIPDNRMNVVILASTYLNRWYPDKWQPGVEKIPDCFSQSLTGRDMKPHPLSINVQNTDCMTCPQLKWGSEPERKKAKWCKEQFDLVFLPADALTSPEAVAKAGVARGIIPVTSGTAWKMFAMQLVAGGDAPWQFMVELSVKPHAKNQYEVLWDKKGKITDVAILNSIAARLDWARELTLEPYKEREVEAAPVDTGKKKKF